MSDGARTALLVVVRLAAFAALVGGVMVAQRSVGWGHLGVMLLCLSGLLVMLWRYNRRHT